MVKVAVRKFIKIYDKVIEITRLHEAFATRNRT